VVERSARPDAIPLVFERICYTAQIIRCISWLLCGGGMELYFQADFGPAESLEALSALGAMRLLQQRPQALMVVARQANIDRWLFAGGSPSTWNANSVVCVRLESAWPDRTDDGVGSVDESVCERFVPLSSSLTGAG
jgi:hypothetical protein